MPLTTIFADRWMRMYPSKHLGFTALLCGSITAAVGVILAVPVAASPCDGPDCVPNVRAADRGQACVARRFFPFGLDVNGNTFICLYGGSWSSAPPLLGVRAEGGTCASNVRGVAQSAAGLPLLCSDYGIWQLHTDGLPY